ncbi:MULTISPECIES: chemotaxis protein CheB [Chryseobacterium]|uniref:protein-glutamate methylesterase n=1 Tax=Chryseobacterium salivictor TaxID=2547600 RepID=A0A4P6ZFY8_9FLAO|nr:MULTISPECIES: chemotaxis protein CheB [Chryseobacterium]MDQ0477973.1 two-component system chemotaxis response regulator CheB [Chryseobacterium sp. MDT2-18]QBO58445.1 Chemotaxis response regulator protein-glutamate methylesterase [Chryseobacterium salivictor]
MEPCEALMIGGSAGSLEVLIKILPGLDPALAFPIIIVLHRKSGKDSILTHILASKTQLNVKELEEKEKIIPGTLYIAPPDYHVLIENDRTFSLDASEKVNFSRPSIDVAFESAAEVYGENLVCLLLSGANSDGTAGLQKVKEYGGKALIQNPSSAVVSYMPEYALEHVTIDAVLDTGEMPNYINNLGK